MAKSASSSTSTHENSIFSDLLDLISDSICFYAHAICSPLMRNKSSPTLPLNIDKLTQEPPMKTKTPSLATRRAACTHPTMERLYGNYQCDVCHRPSQLGWVYLCTQDDLQHAPVGDVDETSEKPILAVADLNAIMKTPRSSYDDLQTKLIHGASEPELQMPVAELAPWIESAIKNKQYSPNQIEILRAQKQKVVDVAKAAIEQYEQESIFKDPTCQTDSRRTDGESQSKDEHVIEGSPLPTQLKHRMFPYCKFRACQTCRPAFRDRTWQRFDEMYTNNASVITNSKKYDVYDTRPLASRKVMQEIGRRAPEPIALSKPPLVRRRHASLGNQLKQNENLRTLESSSEIQSIPYATDKIQITNPTSLEPQDIADADSQISSGTRSFHESISRVLKDLSRRDKSRSSKKRRTRSEFNESLDAALCNSLDMSLLEEAASVPLPEQNTMDGLVGEVVELEKVNLADGIAVKEESAELGAADVITSV